MDRGMISDSIGFKTGTNAALNRSWCPPSLGAPPMNSPSSPSAMDKEQARKRREEAQKANILLQARRIAEQRERAARQNAADAPRQQATGKPLASRSVYDPPVQPTAATAARPAARPAATAVP